VVVGHSGAFRTILPWLSDARLRTGFHPMRQLVLQGYSAIEEYRQRKVHVTGVPSGFYDLDEMTAGFQKSDFVVIAGRPSMGKTSFAMNIAENAAVLAKAKDRRAVAVFSLEMSKEALVQRLLCSLAKVDIHKIRRGYASADEYKRLQNAAAQLHEAPGLVPRLLAELALRGLGWRLARVLAAGRHLPEEIAGNVAILPHQQHGVPVEEGENPHALATLHHTVERAAAVRQLDHVLADGDPLVVVDRPGGGLAPGRAGPCGEGRGSTSGLAHDPVVSCGPGGT